MVWPTLGSRTAKEQEQEQAVRPSVCPGREGYIDRLLYGTQQRGVRWTNAGSATLSAYAVAERRLDIL